MAEPKGTSEFVCESHIFDIFGYSTIKGLGTGKYIRSSPLHVGGHDWVIQFFPNGRHSYTTGYVSLYVKLLNPPNKKVSAILSFSVRTRDKGNYVSDQSSCTANSSTLLQTFDADNPIQGVSYFMKKSDLSSSKYLSDDCLTFRCILWVCMDSPATPIATVPKPPSVPSSNLAVHFSQLLESGDGADVNLAVGGRTFFAHKCVLAARSPVFREELFGSKSEKAAADRVVVEGIDAATFQTLLHFIYTDLLPDCVSESAEAAAGSSDKSASIISTQRLLAGAARYKLDRLKMICENKLSENEYLTMETVATTLALAEEHNCHQLRDTCMEFAVKKENYLALPLTDGFEKLKQSHPAVFKELVEKAT
ncbi:BTB/POZ and MATH domain-containing protein 2 [Carex littledalei]|uniref:BTB/POZ and MATH domain-containing protein 2 n=1 Tax=Carex littledalei TaxID=544730 RepID=A0A833QW31_9POAL|nr:BTB/POZ and MATH domain-containing protein 2 [Carex littledalei]